MKKRKSNSTTKAPHEENKSAAENLTQGDVSGSEKPAPDLAMSDTDEDEDEGLGDGNIGKSTDDPFAK